MQQPIAPKDDNGVPAIVGTSSADESVAVLPYVDPNTHAIHVKLSGSETATPLITTSIVFGASDVITTEKFQTVSILDKELIAENLMRVFAERPDVVGGGNLTVKMYEGCKVDGENERFTDSKKTITVTESTGICIASESVEELGYGTGNIKIGAAFAVDIWAAVAWSAESTAYAVGDIVTNDGKRYICTVENTSAVSNEPGTPALTAVSDWVLAEEYVANDYVQVGAARYKCKLLNTANADNEPGAVTAGEVDAWAALTEYGLGDYVGHNAKYYRCILAHTSAAGDEPDDGVSAATNWVEVTFWDTYWDAIDLWDEFWAEHSVTVNVAIYSR